MDWEKLNFTDEKTVISSDENDERTVFWSKESKTKCDNQSIHNERTVENDQNETNTKTLVDAAIRSRLNVRPTKDTKQLGNRIVKFSPNEILFNKWSIYYHKEASELGRTEEQIIEQLIEYVPEDLRLTIEIFPKNVTWPVYSKRIEGLFVNQKKNLLIKRAHKEYASFLEFFTDKLRLLDKLSDEEKKNQIYSVLDPRFKTYLGSDSISSMKLYKFAVECSELEKLLGWYCETCRSTTHRSTYCPKLDATKAAYPNPFHRTFERIDALEFTDHLILILYYFIVALLIGVSLFLIKYFIDDIRKDVFAKTPLNCTCDTQCTNFDFKSVQNYISKIDLKKLFNITNYSLK